MNRFFDVQYAEFWYNMVNNCKETHYKCIKNVITAAKFCLYPILIRTGERLTGVKDIVVSVTLNTTKNIDNDTQIR